MQTAVPEPEKTQFTPSPFSGFDFNFHKHNDSQPSSEIPPEEPASFDNGFENTPGDSSIGNNGFDDNSFGNNGFDDNSFGNNGFDDNSFGNNGFDDNSFGNNGFDDSAPATGDFGDISFGNNNNSDGDDDDFGLGFGNKSISSDRPAATKNDGGKPSGGRFKKRK